MTRNELKTTFQYLSNDANFPEGSDKRIRGHKFEKLLFGLLKLEGLEPRGGFRPDGEEIDGSFLHQHHVFLLEAKWHKSPMPASSIYQFKGKVDGKLIGTIGIYISISGFSSEAVDALTYGKTVNILLFDGKDFAICIEEEDGFKKALNLKIREATEKGTPYHSLNSISIQSDTGGNRTKVKITESNEISRTAQMPLRANEELVIIVEGRFDQLIVSILAERILKTQNLQKRIHVFVSGGKFSMAKLANSVYEFNGDRRHYILVADSDEDRDETRKLLANNMTFPKELITIVTPEPEIETWFKEKGVTDRHTLWAYAGGKQKVERTLPQLLNEINLDLLKQGDESFKAFYDAVVRVDKTTKTVTPKEKIKGKETVKPKSTVKPRKKSK